MESTKWEYRIEDLMGNVEVQKRLQQVQEQFNELGAQGWELVSTPSSSMGAPLIAIFKREKQ